MQIEACRFYKFPALCSIAKRHINMLFDYTYVKRGGGKVNFMFNEDLKIAYEKSDEVLNSLDCPEYDIPSTQEIVNIVADKVNCKIRVLTCSFHEMNENLREYGAMMWTEKTNDEQRIANIVVNSDNDAKFQRFSLVHELGHLMTEFESEDLFVPNEKYIVSTHINYKVTSIPPEKYRSNKFLLNEQKANVFALRVLMPKDSFYSRLNKLDSISDVAKSFGLSRDAVFSRIMLVE